MNRPVSTSQRNWGARIREYLYRGMRMITLENEALRVGVLAGKGADIVELNYKPRDLDFIWLSPQGVQNLIRSAGMHRNPLATFVEAYPGGWQEVFPNGGAPSSWAGAEFGQHDEVFALPWDVDIVDDSETSVAVCFSVHPRKVPCFLERTMRLDAGSTRLQIEERLVNTSPVPVSAMWGHHITFGQPFLRAGHRIRLPESVVVTPHDEAIAPGGRRVGNNAPFLWPHARAESGDALDLSVVPERGTASDIVYMNGFDNRAWYEVVDPENGIGARVEWDATTMPYLWYWQEFGATTGYPWYGRNYNIGLEPFSSYPTNGLAGAVDNGSALTLAPEESRDFWMAMSVLDEQEKT